MDVTVASPEKTVWQGDADLVVARSPEGEFGIMRGHIPFLAGLVPSLVTVVSGQERRSFFVPGGFLEASGPADGYHVIVLADDAEEPEQIDGDEARRRLEDARRRAEQEDDEGAREQLRIAQARVQVVAGR